MVKPIFTLCLIIMISCSEKVSVGSDVDNERDIVNASANSTSENYYYEYVDNGENSTPDRYQVARDIMDRFGLIIIVCLALFGNTVIIIILTKKRNRAFPTSMYLASLAISSILQVLVSPFKNWLEKNINDGKIMFSIEIECKFIVTLLYSTTMTSSWALAIIAIERIISVLVPLKVKVICSSDVAKRVLVGKWLTFIVCSLFLAVAFKPHRGADCVFIDTLTTFYVFDLSVVTLTFVVPFAIILAATIIILVQLFRRKRQILFSKGVNVWPITITLLFTNIAFLATVMPINIVFMVYKIQILLGLERIKNIHFWMSTFRFLLYTNSCLNFFIYFLSGSRFRAEVKELFSFRSKGNKNKNSSTRSAVNSNTTRY